MRRIISFMNAIVAALVLLGVLAWAGLLIGVLLVVVWGVRVVVDIANDPNAGPYRQVR